MLVKKATVVPIENIVRGYISGSGWTDYNRTGEISGINVEEGDRVKVNTLLAKLDDRPFRLEYNKSKALLNRLLSTHKRNQDLKKNKIISNENYDRIKFDLETQKASAEISNLNLSYTSIKAPM